MLPDGGEAAVASLENAKRMRRPSVRLHQPYYENPGHRKLQQQWNAKRGAAPPTRPRTAHSKINVGNEASKGGETGNLDFEDHVAIGNKRNFKRKRVRSYNSRNQVAAKSRRDGCRGSGNSPLSSGEREQEEEEEDLGGNGNGNGGIDSKLVVEDSNPSSPFGEDDHKLGDDNKNVLDNEQWRELMSREDDGDSNGVRMWLNDLGLEKYVGLFEIHGVDDEVLPLLTLEDLKDMGINEVGVRRKMYSSIQKLDRW